MVEFVRVVFDGESGAQPVEALHEACNGGRAACFPDVGVFLLLGGISLAANA